MLKGEAAKGFARGPTTGHCGGRTGEEGKTSHRGTKPSANRLEEGRFPPGRRAGAQLKSASGWLP